jgi:hypothetical protein
MGDRSYHHSCRNYIILLQKNPKDPFTLAIFAAKTREKMTATATANCLASLE